MTNPTSLPLDLVDALKKGVSDQLAQPLTSAQLSVWYGIASTEIAAARRNKNITYQAKTFVLSQQHQMLGLDLAHYALQHELDESEMATLLG